MSIEAMTWAWQQKTASPTSKVVLVALADHADWNHSCWPGHEAIAERCEVDRRTVIRHVKKLEEAGLLEISSRYGEDGRRTSNRYRLPVTGCHPPRDIGVTTPVTPVSQEPPIHPPIEKEGPDYRADVSSVFAHWQQVLGREKSRLTKGRRDKIQARLKAGATVDQMKRAIDGCAGSEFHRAGGHTDLTLILRSEEKMEAFCQMPRPEADEDDFFAGVNG